MNAQDTRVALTEGSQIGVYEIRELIAEDLLSLSYEAWNHHLNAPVLLREYFPLGLAQRCVDGTRLEAVSDADRERYANGLCEFLYEAERLVDIEHNAIAKVLNALEFNDTGYQIMAFERDQSLAAWIDSAYTFKLDDLKEMFERLLSGLEAVHDHGLVHGRICPEHIVLRGDGHPVLVNYSATLLQFAREEGELSALLCEGYAPAEQYETDHVPAHSDDLYALAATLHHCITGRAPLSSLERLELLLKGDRDPMESLESAAENEAQLTWLKALDWMLLPEAKDRPHNAKQVETLLVEISQGEKKGRRGAAIGESGSWFRSMFTDIRILGTATVVVLLFSVGVLLVRSLSSSDIPESRVVTSNSSPEETTDSLMQRPATVESASLPTSQGNSESSDVSETLVEKSETPNFAALEEEFDERVQMSDDSVPLIEADSIESKSIEADPLRSTADRVSMAAVSKAEQSISTEQDEKSHLASVIAGYLAAAEKNLLVFNLTTPQGDNAYSGYQAVLELDPDNPDARDGIERIVERYEWLIDAAMRKGRFKVAEVYLTRAESIALDSSSLISLRSKLEGAHNTKSAQR